jgi:hypothetical protein
MSARRSASPIPIEQNTMSKQIETPVLVDIHGTKPPCAAEFGKAVSKLDGTQTARVDRRHALPVTYGKRDPDRDGRASLRAFIVALDASPLSLRRDFWSGIGRRGDHAIHGKHGHIYPDGDGYLLCVGAQSARRWSAAKRKLSFCRLKIDGEDEGTLHLDHLPLPAEAKAIRQVMAIRKRRKPSGEARRDLVGHFTPDISTVLAAHIHFSG